MMNTMTPAPHPLAELEASATAEPELVALKRLQEAGLPLAPMRVVPASVEETFYRLNNLPERLRVLFRGVDLRDPDEDDVEEIAPEAQELVRTHFLLDEFIDLFYGSLAGLPSRVRVRRPGEMGRPATRGRPALIALKATWTSDWSFEALMDRLAKEASIALQARPVILTAAGWEEADAALTAQVAEVLGEDFGGRVPRLEPGLGITGITRP